MVPTRMSSLSISPIETRGFIAAGKNPVASVVSILVIASLLLRRHGHRFDLDQIFGAGGGGYDDRRYGRRGVASPPLPADSHKLGKVGGAGHVVGELGDVRGRHFGRGEKSLDVVDRLLAL